MSGILTAIGEQKVAASFGGQLVSPTMIRIGDGNGGAITPSRLMTDLVRRVGQAYPITASARDATNPNMWRIQTEIPPGEGPFTLREIAVFDADGDMIAIAAHPTAEFQGPGGMQLLVITDIVFPISAQANVSVSITASALVPLHRHLRPFFLSVESASQAAPPANPGPGASYVVAAAPTGAWVGQAGALAQWSGADWLFTPPPIGHVIHAIDTGVYMRREASAWVPFEASQIAAGLIALASEAEAIEGTSNTGAITPATLDAALEARFAAFVTPNLGDDLFRHGTFL